MELKTLQKTHYIEADRDGTLIVVVFGYVGEKLFKRPLDKSVPSKVEILVEALPFETGLTETPVSFAQYVFLYAVI